MGTESISAYGFLHHYYQIAPQVSQTRPIIAIHGFGTTGERTFKYLVPFLEQAGVPLVAPDLLGTGASEKPDITYSLELYSKIIVDLVRSLGLDKPVLLGHSMGGKIAAATAALHPDSFSGLILANSGGFSRLAPLLPVIANARLSHLLMERDWFFRGILPGTLLGPVFRSEESRAQFRRFRSSHQMLDLRLTGILNKLSTIKIPSLIIWGKQDRLLSHRIPFRIQQYIPESELVFLQNAGHAPMKDAPEAFTEAVIRFMFDLEENRL